MDRPTGRRKTNRLNVLAEVKRTLAGLMNPDVADDAAVKMEAFRLADLLDRIRHRRRTRFAPKPRTTLTGTERGTRA